MNTSLEQVAESLKDTHSHNKALTYVITGASSGIGLDAAKLLLMLNPMHRIILVARTMEKAESARDQVVAVIPKHKQPDNCCIIPMACNHCSFESVRQFARNLRVQLDQTYRSNKWEHTGIDALCLNAAVLLAKDSNAVFTQDGLEVTFQTNHMAPFLIANLLEDLINPGGRVVFSTSGLHLTQQLSFEGMIDSETGNARKGFEMMDGAEFQYKKAYAASKLCNVATCLEVNERLQKRRGAVATCFSPGLMTTSGLFRRQQQAAGARIRHNKDALRNEKTVLWGSGSLVYMAVADETAKQGGLFWSDAASATGSAAVYGNEFAGASIQNVDIYRRRMLWFLSCQLAGIPRGNCR